MTTDPASLLPVALQAADTAADMMRARRPASVTEKKDRDLVSDVDIAIERQVRHLLAQATPDIAFLGEEEGRTGDQDAGWVWTLDPIDGTSNYAHGIPLCATSLALLHRGGAVLGVISAPFLGHRYHAIEGQGAYSGDRQLSASATARMRDAVVAIGDYATGPGADRANEVRLALTVQLASRVHRLRMIGTAALDLAWVADGLLDCSITLSNNPWDTSAGVLIARESGATVTDADGTRHNQDSAVTIAATPGLIEEVLRLVREADSTGSGERGRPADTGFPYAAFDRVLGACSVLIFEFDGAVCDFSAALPADSGVRLLAAASTGAGSLPLGLAAKASAGDPYELAGEIAALGGEPARRAAAELDRIEDGAAEVAAPSGYVHEVLAACRDSGRTPVIVARQSVAAVRAWLARFGLDDQVRHVIAADRSAGSPDGMTGLIGDAVAAAAAAGQSALITRTADGVQSARQAGLHSMGYARTQADGDQLAESGADSVMLSLADLTLRLRARPLGR
jgi:myo-inositol-1(or 4)-monophosphatase